MIKKIYNKTLRYAKIPSYIVFGIIATIPLVKCYFKVPYIFCSACPNKCAWGHMRKFMIPMFLLINVDRKRWCFGLCPYGFIQTLQMKYGKVRLKIPRILMSVRYLFLLFVTFIIIITAFSYLNSIRHFFYVGGYNFIMGTFLVSLIIFIMAFFIPKFWCNYFCPIGSFSDLVLKLKRKLFK